MNNYKELNEDLEVESIEEGFVVDGLEKLSWVMRKVAYYQKEIDEVNALSELEIERINKWKEKKLQELESSKNFLSNKAFDYHEKVLMQDPKKKSISTPYGKVKSTTRKPSVEKVNEEELKAYVRVNKPYLLEVQQLEKLNWADLKKQLNIVEVDGNVMVLDEDGQVVNGVSVKQGETTFKVEISE